MKTRTLQAQEPTERQAEEAEQTLTTAYQAALVITLSSAIVPAGATFVTAGMVVTAAAPAIAVASSGMAVIAAGVAATEASRLIGRAVSPADLDPTFANDVSNMVQRDLTTALEDAVTATIREHGNDATDPAVRRALAQATDPDSAAWTSHRTRMARTLATASMGEGAIAAAKQEQRRGLDVALRWRTRRDARVRPTHKRADGQTVDIGQRFVVGGSPLKFPGDPKGSPAEIYGCRCRIRIVRTRS